MSKEKFNPENNLSKGDLVTLNGMYQDYFLDYASYVILERAVPHVNDGLKPVQRRILHAMKEMDDGRFHKVANIIGQTMQYHPHGDAAIGDALVNLGQKDLLIECQGNWGDIRTGDSAAAPRYIEARLSKFALEVAFNAQTTEWQMSYDGRKREPVTLPMKFPLVLAQGVEGIAVGLATKIMPHNFIELIKASIKILQGKKAVIYPDFQTGGYVDVSEYNDGLRGGRIKVRAKIEQIDKSTLAITQLPYGVTTGSMIDSILKASEKGQIKVKKVVDNTAKHVEIVMELVPGTSPDVTIDALYAFTDCEVSISPNACVIIDNKPRFLGVSEILRISTESTKTLLGRELDIKKAELEEKWHLASLEKIFIEKRIYRDIEECETWEAVISTIDAGLKKYVSTPSDKISGKDTRLKMMRDITQEDILKLTEIKIKRISKFNSFKADEYIKGLIEELKQVNHDIAHLTEYTIAYFERLLEKYSKDKERKTEITSIEQIQVQQVVANNAKLYVNYKDGFIGRDMKKDEFVCDCSDIDDIIAFTKEGKFKVVRIADKVFVGKDIIHVAVWKKGDDRTTYNMVYLDGKSGTTYAKRFNVTAITRDKEYELTKDGSKGSKLLYFSAQPNGESELLNIQLTPACSARIKTFDFDLIDIAIKSRTSQGNTVTKYPVRKVTQVSIGQSSLGAMKVYIDDVSGRLNTDGRGRKLGAFDTGSRLITIYKDGSYELNELDLTKKFDVNNIEAISIYNENMVIGCIYFEPEKGWTMVKRFKIETSTINQRFFFIPEGLTSKLYFATFHEESSIKITYKSGKEKEEHEFLLDEFIDPKGWKALGNRLFEGKLLKVEEVSYKEIIEPEEIIEASSSAKTSKQVQGDLFGNKDKDGDDKKLKSGDTVEW
jgi:topoisomerase IV subunit A